MIGHVVIWNKGNKNMNVLIEPSAESFEVPSMKKIIFTFSEISRKLEFIFDDEFSVVQVFPESGIDLLGYEIDELR
jgi:hypothetical protein